MKKYWIILASVVLLLLVLWLGRGFIRDTVARTYANLVYGPELNQVFADEFKPVNGQAAAALGLHLKVADKDSHANGKPCWLANFAFFHDTVNCAVTDNAGTKTTPALLSQWKARFPGFDGYLLAHGWTRTPLLHNNVPVQDLFGMGYSTGITYDKKAGKNDCRIEIFYLTEPGDATFISTLTMYEDCTRQVKFFGGSDQLHSEGWRALFHG